ncbi:4'-phosphopantetheinyl transferase family protein [Pelagimonas varians]|uniref:Enterobactin synthase component D n=1 Tax=Pelagimonas varians TaxID=696760 RepID=A0A238KQD1_9RHOB|nr:4'-phosphopantetheinyl transferase superfamily protein [Pelagimonas varians]PYG28866.1 enterobactin synthetase component D [Pelagimonas varians]SMX44322.1 4'-phosphopantetheinyl transferase Npt [Pelagimonas varians]
MHSSPELDLPTRSGGFLSAADLAVARTPVGAGVIARARYDLDAFDPDLFAALGVDRPSRIAGAIAKRQAEFLAGRMMANCAQKALGRAPCPIEIGENRAPVWPAGLTGSISHARGFCASIAVPAALGDPGIDIEVIAKGRTLDAILRSALSEAEREILNSASDRKPAGGLATLCFAAKETLFKALFPTVGRTFGFAAAELRSLPSDSQISLFLTQDLHRDLRAGQGFDIHYELGASEVLTWLVHPRVA